MIFETPKHHDYNLLCSKPYTKRIFNSQLLFQPSSFGMSMGGLQALFHYASAAASPHNDMKSRVTQALE